MKTIVEYDENGKIFHVLSTYRPETLQYMKDNNSRFIMTSGKVDMRSMFVRDGLICLRPEMALDVVNENLKLGDGKSCDISNIPKGCSVTYIDPAGELLEFKIEDGHANILPEDEGQYILTFDLFPFVSETVNISVSSNIKGSDENLDEWELEKDED